jgi:hypothetical protein
MCRVLQNGMTEEEFAQYRQFECGCTRCDCELSIGSDTYMNAHTFDLFDQIGDGSNMLESASTYNEEFGPRQKQTIDDDADDDEFKYFHLHEKKQEEYEHDDY